MADGLAVFLAPGLHRRFRVPRDTLRVDGAVFAEGPGWGRAAALLRY